MCGCEIEGERRNIEKPNTREIHGGEGRKSMKVSYGPKFVYERSQLVKSPTK